MSPAAPRLAAEDEYPGYRWAIISHLWVQQMFGSVVMSSLGVLLPAMRAELSFGALESGWLGAARMAGQLLVFPASILLVRFAPNTVYGLCAALVALATLTIGFAGSFVPVLLALTVYSLGFAFIQVPGNLIRLQWVPPREFATVWGLGMALNACAQSGGLAVIPLVLDDIGGWRSIFLGAGVTLVMTAGAWAGIARERITARYETARAADRGMGAVKRALRRKEFYLLGTAFLGGATAYMTILLFLPTYLSQERGFPLTTAGFITSIMPVGGLAASLSAGYLSDRLGRRKPLIWPAGIILPVTYWLILSPLPPWALAVVALVLGYFAWAPFPAMNAIPFELPDISPSEVAIGQSLVLSIATVGILLGPVVAGAIADSTGSYRLGILVLSGLPALFALVCLILPETGVKAAVARKA